MVPLLARESFEGSRTVEDAAWRSSDVGEAFFDGAIVPCSWGREEVQALLPRGLVLAEPVSGPRDRHPIVLIAGTQNRAAMLLGGITFPTGVAYQEVMFLVPFVKLIGDTRLRSYVPRMYATDTRPTWCGNVFYGFGKCMASIRKLGSSLLVSTLHGEVVMRAAVETDQPWTDCDGGLPSGLEHLREVSRLPVVGLRRDGVFVSSGFDWDFSAASIRPASATFEQHGDLRGRPGPTAWHGDEAATYEVYNLRWRLSWPRALRG